ncbi:MAG: glutamate ligase domain-containing protein [Planctomycetota bacterium]
MVLKQQAPKAARIEQDAGSTLDALAGPAGKTLLLVGAGGCGMRGLAKLFLQAGWTVFGQDAQGFAEGDPLLAEGLIALDEKAALNVSWVVRSAAVPSSDRHVNRAVAGGAESTLYSGMLGEISKLRPVLAVAGSHGKTTCTAWIAFGLREAGIDVGYLVGAEVAQLPASAAWGDARQPLILESCEYARSFHALRPTDVALINVDAEHPDTYPGGLEEVIEAFSVFLEGMTPQGTVFAGPETPDLSARAAGGWSDAPALPDSQEVGLHGAHNRRNAVLVAAILRNFGLDDAQVDHALRTFTGAARRLEVVGQTEAGSLIASDYAHHPVEVAATLQAARERWPSRRLLVVFQPHQAQRFHAYREQFAPSLDHADALLLLEIYRARDPEELQASVAELVPELEARRPQENRPLATVQDHAEGRTILHSWADPDDVILCLGAGDVDAFARDLR